MALKKIILKGEQIKALLLPPQDAFLVKGIAGSGKTTVALYRAKHLLENYRMLFDEARVVIFTYNKVLKNYIVALNRVIEGGYKKDNELPDPSVPAGMNVNVSNFHSWAFLFLREHGNNLTDRTIRKADRFGLIQRIKGKYSATNNVANKAVQFFDEEFVWMKGKMYISESLYIDNPRTGRGTVDRITTKDKHVIWQMFDEYNAELRKANLVDFDDYAILCYQELEKNPDYKPFTHIVIDEAQDLTKAQLMVIARLVSDETKSITLVADAAQRIYKSGFSWHEVGLDIKGARSLEFNKNYRNTMEILEAAKSLLEKDADKNQYTVGEASRHGRKPCVVRFSNFDSEMNAIVKWIKQYQNRSEHGSVAILSTTNNYVRKLCQGCAENGIKAKELRNNIDYDFNSDDVAICTMQSTKGLEFDFVIIADLNDFLLPNHYQMSGNKDDDEDDISTSRRLLYTSMTRAQNILIMTSSDIRYTRFFDELDKDTYKLLQA